MRTLLLAGAFAALLPVAGFAQTAQELENGANDTANVLNYGMGYSLQRYSPLTQINRQTARNFVPVWNYSYDDNHSEESQPLIYKGVLYVTTNSATMALNARTGEQIWKTKVEYPPEVPRIVCCGIINRGAALYKGKVFRTTLDANVIALDANWQGNLAVEGHRLQGRLLADGCAADRRQRGDHRHIRRGVRHTRLHRRLGSGHGQAPVADLHRRGPGRTERQILAGRYVAARRRIVLDHRLVRSRVAHRLLGHRQRRIVEPDAASRRQPLHVFDPRA